MNLALALEKSLEVRIHNQPFNSVAVGNLRGDQFVLADSLVTSNIMTAGDPVKLVNWIFPSDARPGMYRIVFGQTTYARVMDEPPQLLDFIYNGEDIQLETDFKAPTDSLKVIASEENYLWFSFLKKEKEIRQQLKELEMEVNYYQDKLSEFNSDSDKEEKLDLEAKAANAANTFNLLQMERDSFISGIVTENAHLYAARIIKTYREPFRDGYLSEQERQASWQNDYFRFIDFSDEALIDSPVLSEKIFSYLVTYNQKGNSLEQRENAYIEAVDAVMLEIEKDAGQGGVVYEFVLDYLVDGFERLSMNKVLAWIAEHYAEGLCQTEDKSTLRRKLESQKMVAGTIVPDFTLNDLNGQPVTFSQVLSERNLLFFWASWCPHCNNMLPLIKSLCSTKPNFGVIAVSLDTAGDEWQTAVAQAGIEQFINLSDLKKWDGKVAEDYNIYATPTMFLVNSERKLLAVPSTLEELTKAIDNL